MTGELGRGAVRALRGVSSGHGASTASTADYILRGGMAGAEELISSIVSGVSAEERAHSLCAFLWFLGVVPTK